MRECIGCVLASGFGTKTDLFTRDEHHHAQALDSSIVPATKGNRYQNSRAYLMAFIGFMGIFLFG